MIDNCFAAKPNEKLLQNWPGYVPFIYLKRYEVIKRWYYKIKQLTHNFFKTSCQATHWLQQFVTMLWRKVVVV
jgi:hypothetical protein